jgi:hypothetical protein
MKSIMVSPIPLANIEIDQEFDDVLVEHVAKIIAVLPNLED